MSKTKCPLCERKIEEKELVYHHDIEEMLIDVIKNNHPQWIDNQGACPRCVEYYRTIFGPEEEGE